MSEVATMQYNAISDKLKELVKWPKDAKGKDVANVQYQLLHKPTMTVITPDNSPAVIPVFPGVNIPYLDVIYDAGYADSVQIAYYKQMRQPKPGQAGGPLPAFEQIFFAPEKLGILTVTKADTKLFAFMELTNANKDSVNPDKIMPSIGYLFERVKPEATADDLVARKFEGMRVAAEISKLTHAERQQLAPNIGVNGALETNQLLLAMIEAAEKNPELAAGFLATETSKLKALVAGAVKQKIIKYVADKQGWVNHTSGEVLVHIPPGTGEPVDLLVEFLQAAPAGKSIVAKLSAEVKP